jgi:hypothetical protein
MFILFLPRLLIALTGLAFLVGAAAPAAKFMACMGAANTTTGDCCATMAMEDHATPEPMKQVPCKGISPDCAKEFGCISSPALPAPSITLGSPTDYGRVVYWSPHASRAGLSIKPGLFPPITRRITA